MHVVLWLADPVRVIVTASKLYIVVHTSEDIDRAIVTKIEDALKGIPVLSDPPFASLWQTVSVA